MSSSPSHRHHCYYHPSHLYIQYNTIFEKQKTLSEWKMCNQVQKEKIHEANFCLKIHNVSLQYYALETTYISKNRKLRQSAMHWPRSHNKSAIPFSYTKFCCLGRKICLFRNLIIQKHFFTNKTSVNQNTFIKYKHTSRKRKANRWQMRLL